MGARDTGLCVMWTSVEREETAAEEYPEEHQPGGALGGPRETSDHRGGREPQGVASPRPREGALPGVVAMGASALGQARAGVVCRESKTIQTDQNHSASYYGRAWQF